MSSSRILAGAALAALGALSPLTSAPALAQALADPAAGTLELLTPLDAQRAKLDLIDGLVFDPAGNLLGVREVSGAEGGVVYVDTATGNVTELVENISRADQIDYHSPGVFYVTSEVSTPASTDRIFRVDVTYWGGVPTSATAQDLVTSSNVGAPEGLVVLPSASAYGDAGDLYVAEDKNPAKVIWIDPDTGAASTIANGFQRSEGLAFGDFAGAEPAALYTAETVANRVARIDSSGAVTTLGDPAAVGLSAPDNVEFGPDGFLYVSEDRNDQQGRILRVDPDGTHTVFATGFGSPQGMAFHPATGDLYIAEQDYDRIWQVRFAAAAAVPVPVASSFGLVLGALAMLSAGALVRPRRPR